MRFNKPNRWSNPNNTVIDLIDQLELVFNETTINNTVDVESDSIDYDWIKDKVKEEVKGPIWKKYQAILALEEFEDTSAVSSVAIAEKINQIIAALKA